VDGQGRPEDVNLLLDVCDNISVGMAWPPRQTTICPLGQSATTPIASAVMRFRDEFEAYVGGPVEVTVDVLGAAFVGPVSTPAEAVAGA
jgi:NADH:ubiquinone oxidoreductase subunit F (NADH-binding)